MKRFLLVLSIVFISKSVAFSQSTFNPFKLDGVEWLEIEGRPTGSTVPGAGTDFYCNFYKICGDTVHSGTTYKKVFYGSTLYYLGATGCPPMPGACVKPTSPPNFSFYCFFRQDTVTKSNYFKKPGWSSDSLMVCYNLNVGDTIKRGFYSHTSFCSGFPIVSQTDSILVGGKKFKIYYTNNCAYPPVQYCRQYYNNAFLIEGLGAWSGLFCIYSLQAEYAWNNVDSMSYNACSNHSVQIRNIETVEETVISPNPNTGVFTLETNSASEQTIQLLDVTGRIVLTQIVAGKSQIDVSKLPDGIYNLSVANKDFVVNRRIIISK